jgi:hypothetical protein
VTASCRICGRQVEVSESGQPMPCVPACLRQPDAFLAYAADTCVNPAPEPPASRGPRPAVLANIRRSHRREEW